VLVDDHGVDRLAYLPVLDPRILFEVLLEQLDNRLEFMAGFVSGELEKLFYPPNDLVLMCGFRFAVWSLPLPLSSPVASCQLPIASRNDTRPVLFPGCSYFTDIETLRQQP
jgi:hypothetical protein